MEGNTSSICRKICVATNLGLITVMSPEINVNFMRKCKRLSLIS